MKDIKEVITKMKDQKDNRTVAKNISQICNEKMLLDIPPDEVAEILRKTPKTSSSQTLSFSHFMYAMGSPKLARQKNVSLGG